MQWKSNSKLKLKFEQHVFIISMIGEFIFKGISKMCLAPSRQTISPPPPLPLGLGDLKYCSLGLIGLTTYMNGLSLLLKHVAIKKSIVVNI